jgi:hypothetical protein
MPCGLATSTVERPEDASLSPVYTSHATPEFPADFLGEVIVSWCDKLASTPAVGVRLDKSYAPISTLLEPFSPVVSTWVDKEKDLPAFTVDQQDQFSSTLQTHDGYSYLLNPEQLTVEFKHRLRIRAQSAGPPTADLMSKPRPYTEVLADVTKRLLQMVELVIAGKARKLLRIGIVSTTLVSEDEMPPGISRFLKHVTKPWNTDADSFNFELTTKLSKDRGATHQDRCIHALTKREDGEGLVTIRLDYQRIFDAGKGLSASSLPGLIRDTKDDALGYFEDVAQGERFDA